MILNIYIYIGFYKILHLYDSKCIYLYIIIYYIYTYYEDVCLDPICLDPTSTNYQSGFQWNPQQLGAGVPTLEAPRPARIKMGDLSHGKQDDHDEH